MKLIGIGIACLLALGSLAFVPGASAECATGNYACMCSPAINDPCPEEEINCYFAFTVERYWNPGGAGIWCDGGSVPVRFLGIL